MLDRFQFLICLNSQYHKITIHFILYITNINQLNLKVTFKIYWIFPCTTLQYKR